MHRLERAALSTVMAALRADVQGGEYFGPQGVLELKGKPGRVAKADCVEDLAVARRLWEVSEELVGCEFLVG